LFSMRSTNSGVYRNFVEGLMENDADGNLQGLLAKSWKVSDDGLTYTYTLRDDAKWYTSTGEEYAKVKASDFVTGLKHAADSQSEMLYLVQDSIKGLDKYVSGEDKDFSHVGIKADDKAGTVTYTLSQPETFWNSKTTYSVLFPLNADFLKSEGKNFGKVGATHILYNGPYVLKNYTSKSVIEYTANDNYWDKKNVHIKDIKLTFDDGSNPANQYNQFAKGNYSAARIYPNDPSYKDVEKNYKDNVTYSLPGGSTYNLTFNFNRQAYNITSKKDDASKANTKKAILNKNFRAAFEFAFDKASYNAQSVGDAGKLNALRNSLIPGTFVNVGSKTYGQVLQEELNKLNPDWEKIDVSKDGNNDTYQPTLAKKYIEQAKADGVTFPVHLDIVVDEASSTNLKQVQSMKKTVEDATGKQIIIDINQTNKDKYMAATYLASSSAAADYDISNASGWGPDYVDPSTYLDIYNTRNGSMLTTIGLDGSKVVKGTYTSGDAVKAIGLEEYDALLDAANKLNEPSQTEARYTAYAKAEAWLLNNFIQVPIYADGGTPGVSTQVPFTASYGWAGIMNNNGNAYPRFKYEKLQKDPVTKSQYNKALKAFQKANAKATTKDQEK